MKLISGTRFSETITSTGDDSILAGDGADTVQGGGGADVIRGEAGADYIYLGKGVIHVETYSYDVFGQNAAGEWIVTGQETASYTWDEYTAENNSGTVFGGDGDDVIKGSTAADVLDGGAGSDQITGYGGGDTITGGSDNDFIQLGGLQHITESITYEDWSYDEATDSWIDNGEKTVTYTYDINDPGTAGGVVHGGDGDDYLEGSNGNDLITGDAGNDNIVGNNGNDTLTGNAGDDNITVGGNGRTLAQGGDGNDALYTGGGGGYVYLRATSGWLFQPDDGGDTLDGGAGNDYLSDYQWNDTTRTLGNWLIGGDGDDSLSSGGALNTVDGGAGNDWFYISGGDHARFTGGAGADIFSLTPATAFAPVVIDDPLASASPAAEITITIADFAQGTDKIDVSGFAYELVYNAEWGYEMYQARSVADILSHNVTVSDTNGDGHNDVVIEDDAHSVRFVLTSVSGLSATDFYTPDYAL